MNSEFHFYLTAFSVSYLVGLALLLATLMTVQIGYDVIKSITSK